MAWPQRLSRFRLNVKVLLVFELVLLLAVATLLAPVWVEMREQVVTDLQNELLAIAMTASLQIDGDLHRAIRTGADVDTPAFRALRDALTRIRDVNQLGEQHIYTFYRDSGQVRFGVMTHGRPFVGDPYTLRPEMVTAFAGSAVATDLYDDEYGQWISAYAPIHDARGDVVGLLAVDRPAERYFERYTKVKRLNLTLGLLVLAMSSMLGWLVLNRIVNAPIRKVREGMLALGRHDFTHRVSLRTRDELQELGDTLNHISQQLNVARTVQNTFIPRTLPRPQGFDIAAAAQPCEATAGDYYDAFDLGDGRTVVLVADVTGHGLGPSLLMSACRSGARALSGASLSPGQIVARLDALLEADLAEGGRFITMILGVLEPDGSFHYCNAGHGPALLATPRGVTQLPPHRPPLGVGIGPDGDHQSTVRLAPGDRILLASDGLSEGMSHGRELFGVERIVAIVRDRSSGAAQVVRRLLDALTTHCSGPNRHDDVTVLCIDRLG